MRRILQYELKTKKKPIPKQMFQPIIVKDNKNRGE